MVIHLFMALFNLNIHMIFLQKEFFQDDVFPETAVWWKSALSASGWLSGSDGQHRKISLQPKDMTPGTAPQPVPIMNVQTVI